MTVILESCNCRDQLVKKSFFGLGRGIETGVGNPHVDEGLLSKLRLAEGVGGRREG